MGPEALPQQTGAHAADVPGGRGNGSGHPRRKGQRSTEPASHFVFRRHVNRNQFGTQIRKQTDIILLRRYLGLQCLARYSIIM